MKKQSAGLLVYRKRNFQTEVLLVHPGGPFWSKKDLGAWSIPKGEYDESEDSLGAAKREFEEETGQPAPHENPIDLGEIKRRDGKIIKAWAVLGDLDVSAISSNKIKIEWPPRSGKQMEIPEVDRADWFIISKAGPKMHRGQDEFINRLAAHLQVSLEPLETSPSQASLL